MLRIVFLLFLSLFLWNTASATVIVIEPDNYPADTSLQNISPYLSMVGTWFDIDEEFFWDSVTAQTDSQGYASTGSKVFGNGSFSWWSSSDYLRIDFHQPVAAVQLDYISSGGSIWDNIGILEVYNSSGTRLDTYVTRDLQNGYETMSLYRPQQDITMALAYISDDSAFGRFDHLEVAIPEPASLGILLAGSLLIRYKWNHSKKVF